MVTVVLGPRGSIAGVSVPVSGVDRDAQVSAAHTKDDLKLAVTAFEESLLR